jgi:hypothetical protein
MQYARGDLYALRAHTGITDTTDTLLQTARAQFDEDVNVGVHSGLNGMERLLLPLKLHLNLPIFILYHELFDIIVQNLFYVLPLDSCMWKTSGAFILIHDTYDRSAIQLYANIHANITVMPKVMLDKDEQGHYIQTLTAVWKSSSVPQDWIEYPTHMFVPSSNGDCGYVSIARCIMLTVRKPLDLVERLVKLFGADAPSLTFKTETDIVVSLKKTIIYFLSAFQEFLVIKEPKVLQIWHDNKFVFRGLGVDVQNKLIERAQNIIDGGFVGPIDPMVVVNIMGMLGELCMTMLKRHSRPKEISKNQYFHDISLLPAQLKKRIEDIVQKFIFLGLDTPKFLLHTMFNIAMAENEFLTLEISAREKIVYETLHDPSADQNRRRLSNIQREKIDGKEVSFGIIDQTTNLLLYLLLEANASGVPVMDRIISNRALDRDDSFGLSFFVASSSATYSIEQFSILSVDFTISNNLFAHAIGLVSVDHFQNPKNALILGEECYRNRQLLTFDSEDKPEFGTNGMFYQR